MNKEETLQALALAEGCLYEAAGELDRVLKRDEYLELSAVDSVRIVSQLLAPLIERITDVRLDAEIGTGRLDYYRRRIKELEDKVALMEYAAFWKEGSAK